MQAASVGLFAQRRCSQSSPPPCGEGLGVGVPEGKAVKGTNPVLLSRLKPTIQTVLKLLGRCFRCLGTIDHIGRGHPGLILEIGGAAVEDLICGADRRLALLAPGNELLSKWVLHL